MRRFIILSIVIAGLAGGCSRLQSGRGDKIPVTPPSEVYDSTDDTPPDSAIVTPVEPDKPLVETISADPPANDNDKDESNTPSNASLEVNDANQPDASRLGGDSDPVATPAATGPARVVATWLVGVNNKFLTADDILSASAVELSELPTGITEQTFRSQASRIITDQVRRKVKNLLIGPEAENRLPDQVKKKIDVEVEQFLRDMVVHSDGSRRKLESEMIRKGTTLSQVLDDYRLDLIVREYLRGRFVPRVSVNRRMMLDYYRRNINQYNKPKRVQMQLISLPFDAFVTDEMVEIGLAERQLIHDQALQQANEAMSAVRDGLEFGEVAKRLSRGPKSTEGGLWPMMQSGSFKAEAVEAAAFKLDEGQVSEIIETAEGFYIVKAYKVEPAVVKSFEQVQESIDEALREQQATHMYDEYFQKLMAGATIVQSEMGLEVAVDGAVQRYFNKGSGMR